MTTAQIEEFADFEKIATPNFPVKVYLRRMVIPDFCNRVGLVGWRRLTEFVTVPVAGRAVDISAHFATVSSVWRGECKLDFIGDSEYKLAIAVANQTPGQPSAWYLGFNASADYNDQSVVGPINVRKVMLAAPADAVTELAVNGWKTPYFDDDTNPVNLDPFIPFQYQWGLVEGLKAEIFSDRLGQGDDRTKKAMAKYEYWIAQAQSETTISETPRYA